MTDALIAFAVLGALCGVLYNVFFLFTRIFRRGAVRFLTDFLYCLLCGFLCFICLAAYYDGAPRAVFFAVFLAALLLVRFTLGRILDAFVTKIAFFIHKIAAAAGHFVNFLKKGLQKCTGSLYNKYTKRKLRQKRPSAHAKKKKKKGHSHVR